MSKVYAAVLAGGVGTRMGNIEKPKQFLDLGGKPVLIHTLEKFTVHPGIDEVLVLSPAAWVSYTQDIIRKNIPALQNGTTLAPVTVLAGGDTRNETVMNAIRYIEEKGDLDDDTVIVTHDSVRPFVTHRIIDDNMRLIADYDACDTVIAATDTIVESTDGEIVSLIPDRRHMYQGQTPQTFRAKKLKELYLSLTKEEKEILTDACKIMVLKGARVCLVQGEVFNTKITYPYDITVAKALLGLEDGVHA